MQLTAEAMSGFFRTFSAAFNKGMASAPSYYKSVSMTAPSSAASTTYAWLGQFPRMREWLGPRVIQRLQEHGYQIRNRDFEDTKEINRNTLADDEYGIYGPVFEEMGRAAAELPDELVFGLLIAGFSAVCYDGQPFFDADHPVGDGVNVQATFVANTDPQPGGGPAWFLLDTSRAIKPLIYQPRLNPVLVRKDREDDDNVFWENKVVYGTHARANAGFGLWQLAWGSTGPLTPATYGAARAAMQSQVGDAGRLLGVQPDTLVVSPLLEAAARTIVVADRDQYGATNVWAGSAKLINTPWVQANAPLMPAGGQAGGGPFIFG